MRRAQGCENTEETESLNEVGGVVLNSLKALVRRNIIQSQSGVQ